MPESAARRNRPYAPRLSPVQRREQLLDTVLEIICADGAGAVSVDAVARRCGVTRPVVYGQFADAGDMLRACLDREEQRALAQIAEAVPGPGSADVPAAFRHLFDVYLRAVTEAPHRWRAIFTMADGGTPAIRERVEQARARFARELEAALRESVTYGELEDPELLARHLLAVLWESGRLLLSQPDDFPHERLLRSLDAILAAIVTAPRKDSP
jgi:AcrR family transcriptional regulator